MKVKNLKNTSDLTCGCGSWIKHWEKHSGNIGNKCYVIDCTKTNDIVGGHVKKVNSTDDDWYIVPICKLHNSVTEPPKEFEVNSNSLVPANKSETCDKS